MNKVILVGHLTRDVEMRYAVNDNNTAVGRFTLAVNRPFKRGGEPEADFLPCVAFGKTGELAGKYLAKGIQVLVEDRIQPGSYINREGQKVYTTEIVVERQEFLEKRTGNGQPNTDTAGNGRDGYMGIPDGIHEYGNPTPGYGMQITGRGIV